MAFKLNYADKRDLIPEGAYECRIERAQEDATPNGTRFLDIMLSVRDDVEQPETGRRIDHVIWQKKDPTPQDLALGGYSAKQFLALSEAAGLPENADYSGFDDWCADIAGRAVHVTVEHQTYNGYTNARVKWVNPTAYPVPEGYAGKAPSVSRQKPAGQAPAVPASTNAPAGSFQPLDDDDIPF